MQKRVELEKIVGTEVKGEEEPEGETMMGSGGETLRCPGMDVIFFQINCLLFLGVFGQQPLW